MAVSAGEEPLPGASVSLCLSGAWGTRFIFSRSVEGSAY